MKHSVWIALAFLASPSLAQDADPAGSPLSIAEMQVQRYQAVTLADDSAGLPCCAGFTIYSPGEVVIHVDATLNVAWSEDFDRLSINARDIALALPDEDEPRRMLGHYAVIGVAELGETGLYASRPNDWPEEDRQVYLSGLWRVPADLAEATLMIGEEGERMEVSLDLTGEVSRPVGVADQLVVERLALSVLPTLETAVRTSGEDQPGFLRVQSGQILELQFDFTPTGSNGLQDDRNFRLQSESLTLVGPEGLPLTELGVAGTFGFNRFDSIGQTWGATSAPRLSEEVIYYLGTGAPGIYQLYYLTDQIGEIELTAP